MEDAKTAACTPAEQCESAGIGQHAIILIAAALMAIGLVMVGSATSSLDGGLLSARFWTTAFGRQACFAVVGIGLCLATGWGFRMLLASATLMRWVAWGGYGVAIALLCVVLIPGFSDASHGSQRWIRYQVGGVAVGLQPSEVAKIGLILFLSYWLGGDRSDPRRFFQTYLPGIFAIGLCGGLVGTENFGTAALLMGVALAMLVVSGCKYHHLSIFVVGGAIGLWWLVQEPYRLARLTAYRDIMADPQGAGYQPLQSLTTIASGGWWGVGLGSGLQKYGYLPEAHTDFIFAVLCEELGMVGAGLVLALFCAFLWVGMRISLRAPTRLEQLLAFGLTFLVGSQAAINIAVVTVVAPTTGVPLPFLSAGGSGLWITCTAVGILSAIAARGVARDPGVEMKAETLSIAEPAG